MTKFIGGHSDVVMGVTVTRSDDIDERLRFIQNGMGSVPAPFDCYMALRGLKTLGVRMRQHEANATALAKFLEEHPGVEKVVYPGAPSRLPAHGRDAPAGSDARPANATPQVCPATRSTRWPRPRCTATAA